MISMRLKIPIVTEAVLSLFCDSGGISLKPSLSMDAMRADMGGAATVCASVVTAAALKLPVNIIGELWILGTCFTKLVINLCGSLESVYKG